MGDKTIDNKFFNKAIKRAASILKNKEKLKGLVEASDGKVSDLNDKDNKSKNLIHRVKVILRMVKSYANGTYRVIPWQSIVVLVGALIYFVTPLDLIPDFIPISGFIDDFGVMLWVFKRLQTEIDNYLIWEKGLPPAKE